MHSKVSSTVRLSRPPTQLHAPMQGQAYPTDYSLPSMGPAHTAPFAPVRRADTPQAFYVLGSFALMMVLAAFLSVFGSVAVLSLIDATEDDDDETPVVETASPAASLR